MDAQAGVGEEILIVASCHGNHGNRVYLYILWPKKYNSLPFRNICYGNPLRLSCNLVIRLSVNFQTDYINRASKMPRRFQDVMADKCNAICRENELGNSWFSCYVIKF